MISCFDGWIYWPTLSVHVHVCYQITLLYPAPSSYEKGSDQSDHSKGMLYIESTHCFQWALLIFTFMHFSFNLLIIFHCHFAVVLCPDLFIALEQKPDAHEHLLGTCLIDNSSHIDGWPPSPFCNVK